MVIFGVSAAPSPLSISSATFKIGGFVGGSDPQRRKDEIANEVHIEILRTASST